MVKISQNIFIQYKINRYLIASFSVGMDNWNDDSVMARFRSQGIYPRSFSRNEGPYEPFQQVNLLIFKVNFICLF
jgi:hypothetical protein